MPSLHDELTSAPLPSIGDTSGASKKNRVQEVHNLDTKRTKACELLALVRQDVGFAGVRGLLFCVVACL